MDSMVILMPFGASLRMTALGRTVLRWVVLRRPLLGLRMGRGRPLDRCMRRRIHRPSLRMIHRRDGTLHGGMGRRPLGGWVIDGRGRGRSGFWTLDRGTGSIHGPPLRQRMDGTGRWMGWGATGALSRSIARASRPYSTGLLAGRMELTGTAGGRNGGVASIDAVA